MTVTQEMNVEPIEQGDPDTIDAVEELEGLAHRFKVLSEPARLQILQVICQGERSVQDICDRTRLQQGNVSKHLRLMKDAGVVACRRVGVWRYYRIVDTDLLALCQHWRANGRFGLTKGDNP